jgi:subtilase-type serine protease
MRPLFVRFKVLFFKNEYWGIFIMSFDATAAADSVRTFAGLRKHLKSTALTALLLAATAIGALADGRYVMATKTADGERETTDELEKAAQSWRDDAEFKASWVLAAIRAEYAYILGKSGQGVKVGFLDSGVDLTHYELANPRIHAVTTSGTYYRDDDVEEVKKGDQFSVVGTFIKGTNDSHGTQVAGAIGAARNGLAGGRACRG